MKIPKVDLNRFSKDEDPEIVLTIVRLLKSKNVTKEVARGSLVKAMVDYMRLKTR